MTKPQLLRVTTAHAAACLRTWAFALWFSKFGKTQREDAQITDSRGFISKLVAELQKEIQQGRWKERSVKQRESLYINSKVSICDVGFIWAQVSLAYSGAYIKLQ